MKTTPSKRKVKKQKKSEVGIGVVMTWRNKNNPLGGALPKYLTAVNEPKKCAIEVASKTKRFQQFRGDTDIEFWLCKITLKPIKQVEIPYVEDKF